MRTLACMALAAATVVARAADPSFEVVQVFSNADGTVQFVQLRESAGQDGQQGLAGKTLTVTRNGRVKTFTFPADLPRPNTANRSVLVATPGYLAVPARYAEYKAVTPDYVAFDQFLPAEGGTIQFAGTAPWTFQALPRDGFSAVHRTGTTIRDNVVQNFGGATVSLPIVPVTAFEYYNAALDHYFVTDLAPDIDALDSGRIGGWSRTGKSFQVWPVSMGFLSDVCRYYIPPEHGNSHFFSASEAECSAIASRIGLDPNYSGYVLETSEAFAVALPDASGACANNWTAVYRLWNNRPDSNHRYTTDPAVKAQMIARGYVAEGYGPDAVGMCSPL
ncbi:MAG: hypothetical protein U1F41_11900 [Burkholderiales bacterium]